MGTRVLVVFFNRDRGHSVIRVFTSLVFTVIAILSLFTVEVLGQSSWRNSYGGSGTDIGWDVEQTVDGGFIVIGSTGSFGAGASDFYLFKLDPNGQLLWSRSFGDLSIESGKSVEVLADGYALCGTTLNTSSGDYNMLLIRTDLMGNEIWSKEFGTSGWDFVNDMKALVDGFIVEGQSFGGDPIGQAYTVRLDLSGDTIWTRETAFSEKTEGLGVYQTDDLGFVLCGAIGSGVDQDGFIVKLDASGTEQWNVIVGGDSADYLSGVLESDIGDIVAIGGSESYASTQQIFLVNYDSGGGFNWDQKIGSGSDAAGIDLTREQGGGYAFTGYNTLNFGEKDMILTVVNSGGWFQFGNNYGSGFYAEGVNIESTADNGYVIVGTVEDVGPGPSAVFVVKTDSAGQTTTTVINGTSDPLTTTELDAERSSISIYPNYAQVGSQLMVSGCNEDCRFKAEIIATNGASISLPVYGNYLDTSGLSAGRYVIRLISENQVTVHNLILQK